MIKRHIYATSKSESEVNRILSTVFHSGSSSCDICVFPAGAGSGIRSAPWEAQNVPQSAMLGAGLGILGGAFIGLLSMMGIFPTPDVAPAVATVSGIGALAPLLINRSSWKSFVRHFRTSGKSSQEVFSNRESNQGDFLIYIRARNRQEESNVRKILSEEGAVEVPRM